MITQAVKVNALESIPCVFNVTLSLQAYSQIFKLAEKFWHYKAN